MPSTCSSRRGAVVGSRTRPRPGSAGSATRCGGACRGLSAASRGGLHPRARRRPARARLRAVRGPRLGDTESYIAAAKAILHGSYTTPLEPVDVTGLKIPPSAVGSPERQTYRTPGYPLLLAATGGGGFGVPTGAIIAVQALLARTDDVRARVRLPAALVGAARALRGALTALDPFPKHYVTRILSEVLAGFLVAVTAYAFVRAWQERSARWWLATGAAAAAADSDATALRARDPAARARRSAGSRSEVEAARGGSCGLVRPGRALARLDDRGDRPARAVQLRRGLEPPSRRPRRGAATHGGGGGALALVPKGLLLGAPVRALGRSSADRPRRASQVSREGRRRAAEAREEPSTSTASRTTRRACSGRLSTAATSSGRRTRTGCSRAGCCRSCGRSTGSRSRSRRSAPSSRSALAVPPGRSAIFLLVFTAVNGIHHVQARYAMPVRGLYLGFVALALFHLWARRSAITGRNRPASTMGGVT